MSKSMMKFRIIFVLALLFQLIAAPLQSQAAEVDAKAPTWIAPLNYLALGDSLAFGISSEGLPGNGYPDFLAQSLSEKNGLKSSNKGFSFPKYTAADILTDLKENVAKPVLGIGHEGQTVELHTSIAEADLITISVGANDVLQYFKVDPSTGVPQIDLVNIASAIQQVGADYHKILKSIYEINPKVQVYVMGYYNPFPHLASEIQPQIGQLLVGLNGAIQSGMKGTNAIFVPTSEKIAADYSISVPNPTSIHLSEAGYKIVAEQFSAKMEESYLWISKDTVTAEVKNGTTVQLNWTPAVDDKAVTGYIIYNGKEKVGQVAGNIHTFDVERLEANKAYTFTVAAVDEATNESVPNPTATITTGSAPESPGTGSTDTPTTETPKPVTPTPETPKPVSPKPEVPTPETPKPETPITVPALFSDIENHWAKAFIEQAVAAGIFTGYSDGTFKPEKELTRAQAASVLVRALNLKTDQAAPFEDIEHYAQETQAEIAAAYKFGIVKGNNGKFNPKEPVTRAQLALMVKRAYEIVKAEPYIATELAPYTDIAKYDAETKNAISMLYVFGIVDGADGKFMPGNATTRSQAAKIFVNYAVMVK